MKFLLLFLLCCAVDLAAADFQPRINELGSCKEIVLHGNVLWDTARPEEEVDFRTSDSRQIEAIMRWIKAIPAVERSVRYYGTQPTLSTPECLIFDLTFKDDSHHQVGIYGKLLIFIDNDRSFRAGREVDLRSLFSVIKNRK